jgi:hypothetical protein
MDAGADRVEEHHASTMHVGSSEPCVPLDSCDQHLPSAVHPQRKRFVQLMRIRERAAPPVTGRIRFNPPLSDIVDRYQVLIDYLQPRKGKKPNKRAAAGKRSVRRAVGNQLPADIFEGKGAFPGRLPGVLLLLELGVLLRYEQVWEHCGYSRGELLNSLSLAPGEETTIEVFTWDRVKQERERVSESSSERTETASLTGRASDETVASTRFRLDTGAGFNGGGEVSLVPLGIPGSVEGGMDLSIDTEAETSVENTIQRVTEATRSATDVLRASHKMRISETRELGKESRTTRRVKNENKCHTVSYDYFEIQEHYQVSLRLIDAEVVVLLPLSDGELITPAWLLCHEGILRKHLPDPVYEAGFDGARTLLAADEFQALYARFGAVDDGSGGDASAGGGGSSGGRDAIGGAASAIIEAAKRLDDAEIDGGALIAWDEDVRDEAWKEAGQASFASELRALDADFFDRVEVLDSSCPGNGCEEALRLFLSELEGEMWLLDLSEATVMNLRIPLDDAGLLGALRNAERVLGTTLPAGLAQGPAGAPAAAAAPVVPKTAADLLDEQFGLRNIAVAQVEVNRLICHVNDNLDRYLSALCSEGGPDYWMQVLNRYPQVVDSVQPRAVGFTQGYALFPLSVATQESDSNRAWKDSLIDKFGTGSEPAEVVLPTHGTTLESRLGQCSACEDFIEQHRVLDLRMREHEVALAEATAKLGAAEASRLEARLVASPPLLEDPDAPDAGIHVTLHHESDQEP